jgi:hypothetical protein
MAQVLCEISEGLRPAEATVKLVDYYGRTYFLPADREWLTKIGDRYYMPVILIHIDEAHKAALVELPIETDSGAHRLWFKLEHLYQPNETKR